MNFGSASLGNWLFIKMGTTDNNGGWESINKTRTCTTHMRYPFKHQCFQQRSCITNRSWTLKCLTYKPFFLNEFFCIWFWTQRKEFDHLLMTLGYNKRSVRKPKIIFCLQWSISLKIVSEIQNWSRILTNYYYFFVQISF